MTSPLAEQRQATRPGRVRSWTAWLRLLLGIALLAGARGMSFVEFDRGPVGSNLAWPVHGVRQVKTLLDAATRGLRLLRPRAHGRRRDPICLRSLMGSIWEPP